MGGSVVRFPNFNYIGSQNCSKQCVAKKHGARKRSNPLKLLGDRGHAPGPVDVQRAGFANLLPVPKDIAVPENIELHSRPTTPVEPDSQPHTPSDNHSDTERT